MNEELYNFVKLNKPFVCLCGCKKSDFIVQGKNNYFDEYEITEKNILQMNCYELKDVPLEKRNEWGFPIVEKKYFGWMEVPVSDKWRLIKNKCIKCSKELNGSLTFKYGKLIKIVIKTEL